MDEVEVEVEVEEVTCDTVTVESYDITFLNPLG